MKQDPEPIQSGEARENGRDADQLGMQLLHLPAFRALLRSVEADFYRQLDLSDPLLDLGSGDGYFARFALGESAIGVDPSIRSLRESLLVGPHSAVTQAEGAALPFPEGHFQTVVSNSVLEHIPDVQPALREVSRVISFGGRFIFTVPSSHFGEMLAGTRLLRRLRLSPLANGYSRFFNRISRHHNVDAPEQWALRLAACGLRIEGWRYYFSEAALRALEIGHLQGLPSAVLHALTGRWIVGQYRSNVAALERWLRPFIGEELPDTGAYIFFCAQKVSSSAIKADLGPQVAAIADIDHLAEH